MTKHITHPEKLKKGDKIAIVSPAGALSEGDLDRGIAQIEARGYVPVLGKHLYTRYANGYNYAGTEKQRLSDMNWALNDEEISAVWASRGGYGCQHLLKHLRLGGYRKKPKWYIGYSDNTAMQALLLKRGFSSIHGQTLKTASFGVCSQAYEGIFEVLEGGRSIYTLQAHPLNRKGQAEGILVGGNLALIYALLGTAYSFDFKDKILFIEEIGEPFYALDRMLMSLELAGVFRKIKGLVIGGMTNMGKESDNEQYEASFDDFAYQIIAERIKHYDFPVLFGFPNGHIFDNRPLVIGAKTRLKVDGESILSFEN